MEASNGDKSYVYDEDDDDHADGADDVDDGDDANEGAHLNSKQKEQLEEKLWFELDIDEDRDEPVLKVLVIAMTACMVGCFCRTHCCHTSKGRHHLVAQQPPSDRLTPPGSPHHGPLTYAHAGFANGFAAPGIALTDSFDRHPHRQDHSSRPSLSGALIGGAGSADQGEALPGLASFDHGDHGSGVRSPARLPFAACGRGQPQPWALYAEVVAPIDVGGNRIGGAVGAPHPHRNIRAASRDSGGFKSFGARFDVFSRLASSLEL